MPFLGWCVYNLVVSVPRTLISMHRTQITLCVFFKYNFLLYIMFTGWDKLTVKLDIYARLKFREFLNLKWFARLNIR